MSDSEKIIKDEILYIDDVIPFKFRKNTILVGEFVFNNIICYYKGKPRCPKSDISVYILDSDISEYQKYLDENFAIKGRQILGPSTIFETVSGRKISVTPIGKNGTISNIFKMHPEYYNVAYFNKKFYEPKELNMAIRKFEIHVPRDYKPDMSYFTDVANLFKKNFNIYFHMKIHKDDNNVYKDFKLVFDYNNQLFANALKH